GPALGRLLRRLAGMIVGIFIGTFATIGLMTRSAAGASAALGLVLAAYGAYALFARRFEVVPRHERWASPLTGLVTGMISGASGAACPRRASCAGSSSAWSRSAATCSRARCIARSRHGLQNARHRVRRRVRRRARRQDAARDAPFRRRQGSEPLDGVRRRIAC